jgi:hypothetical protein
MYSNPSGSETMATGSASDKLVHPSLGGIENRLLSANPMQETGR